MFVDCPQLRSKHDSCYLFELIWLQKRARTQKNNYQFGAINKTFRWGLLCVVHRLVVSCRLYHITCWCHVDCTQGRCHTWWHQWVRTSSSCSAVWWQTCFVGGMLHLRASFCVGVTWFVMGELCALQTVRASEGWWCGGWMVSISISVSACLCVWPASVFLYQWISGHAGVCFVAGWCLLFLTATAIITSRWRTKLCSIQSKVRDGIISSSVVVFCVARQHCTDMWTVAATWHRPYLSSPHVFHLPSSILFCLSIFPHSRIRHLSIHYLFIHFHLVLSSLHLFFHHSAPILMWLVSLSSSSSLIFAFLPSVGLPFVSL